tara:strand:+ start:136 stop:246 length:111 start_codon:yes stop_codon:yes gene_type:complete
MIKKNLSLKFFGELPCGGYKKALKTKQLVGYYSILN